MECTVDPCHSPLVYKGGENIEDYGCRNPNCRRFEIHYSPNVKVRANHWFLMGYHLPYTWYYSHTTYRWFALQGFPDRGITELVGLKIVGGVSVQETLHTISYVALPANHEMKSKFYELRDRMMREWLSMVDNHSAQQVIDSEIIGYIETLSSVDWRGIIPPQEYLIPPVSSPQIAAATTSSPQLTISIPDNLRQLINTATTDTNDDAAETAAIRVCRELKRLMNRS